MTDLPRLELLSPRQIDPNPENPRLHFREESLKDLAASIDEVGVLVPIAVYQDSDDPPHYVLFDGERRWICAKRLGLAAVPAIVMAPPDSVANLLKMFNIHMVREPWDDMPTAWSLQKLIERTDTTDEHDLAEMTGLSRDRIRRLLFVLTLPHEYQELIDRDDVPLNFFYELHRNVLETLTRERPAIMQRFGREAILRAFVDKKLANVTTDTVELRKMRPIIRTAADEAGGPEARTELDDAIEQLISLPDRTIQETYENTVEMVIEAERFVRQCQQLVAKLDRLLRKAQTESDRDLIEGAIRDLSEQLASRVPFAHPTE